MNRYEVIEVVNGFVVFPNGSVDYCRGTSQWHEARVFHTAEEVGAFIGDRIKEPRE
jgi:hypothetical protein